MNKWKIEQKPKFDFCPEQYCFCWVPPKGKADLSGKTYDSFEESIEASKNGVVFLNGGCSTPFGPCKRITKNLNDKDCYEPEEFFLNKDGLPDLFFCNPDLFDEEFNVEYIKTVSKLWS